jgi:hypothetical protein
VCCAANKRVNDLCDLGRGAIVLGEEESQRIVAEEAARAERRRWN